MTTTLGTNSSNDIFLDPAGNLTVLIGLPAVMGACATAAKAQLGEMVLAVGQGIPNFQTVWKGTPNYPLFASYLRTALSNVLGVKKVEDLTMSSKDNILKYTATISTEFGRQVING